MRHRTVKFRGEEMDVEVDHDSGYEPDTNAHVIEWHFIGVSPEQHNALNMTQEEEDALFTELAKGSDDGCDDDVI